VTRGPASLRGEGCKVPPKTRNTGRLPNNKMHRTSPYQRRFAQESYIRVTTTTTQVNAQAPHYSLDQSFCCIKHYSSKLYCFRDAFRCPLSPRLEASSFPSRRNFPTGVSFSIAAGLSPFVHNPLIFRSPIAYSPLLSIFLLAFLSACCLPFTFFREWRRIPNFTTALIK